MASALSAAASPPLHPPAASTARQAPLPQDPCADPSPTHWAWQGLCFDVPADWDVTVLEKHYLRADDGHVPRLEIAWRPRGPITQSTLRRRLRRILPGATLHFSEVPAPQLPGSLVFSFDRSGSGQKTGPDTGSRRGMGAVCDVSATHSAFLLLHAPPGLAPAEQGDAMPEALRQLLAAATLPPAGPLQPWRAFGLRLVAPHTYTLARFHFQPGHFHMQFDGPARGILRAPEGSLTYDRLAPASILLHGKNLAQWAASFHSALPLAAASLQGDPKARCLHWRSSSLPQSAWKRRFLGDSGRDLQLKLWLDETDTNILALLARGAPARDEALLLELCTRYAISTLP
ncbi:hypothetical protein [Megalodesulfovibrio paquesii]